jgi:hypothetical protein
VVIESGSGYYLGLFAKISAGNEGTVSPTSSGGTVELTSVCEYSGAANPYVQDGTAVGSATSSNATTLATGAISTAQAASLIVVGGAGVHSGGSPTVTWTTSSVFGQTSNSFISTYWAQAFGQYLPGSAQTNFSDTAHYNSLSSIGLTVIAGFTAAGAAPAYAPPPAPPSFVPQIRSSFWFSRVPWHAKDRLVVPGFAGSALAGG